MSVKKKPAKTVKKPAKSKVKTKEVQVKFKLKKVMTETDWDRYIAQFPNDPYSDAAQFNVKLQRRHALHLAKKSRSFGMSESQYLERLVRQDMANDPDKRMAANHYTISGQVMERGSD